jgi:hypothetical protein
VFYAGAEEVNNRKLSPPYVPESESTQARQRAHEILVYYLSVPPAKYWIEQRNFVTFSTDTPHEVVRDIAVRFIEADRKSKEFGLYSDVVTLRRDRG